VDTTPASSRVYICPICPLHHPGWLKYWQRNDHIRREHPGISYPKGKDPTVPDGDGLYEWEQYHDLDRHNPLPLDHENEKLPMLLPRRGRQSQ
jgi:hypothetical protein